MLDTLVEPTAWTVGGALGKPSKFGGVGGGGGVGTIGEPQYAGRPQLGPIVWC